MADTPLNDTIADNAAGPAEVRGDSITASQHSLPDQIAADRYLAANRALRGNTATRGLWFATIRPPGAA